MTEKAIGAIDTRHLVVLLHIVGLDATIPDQEGYGLSYVDTHLYGSEMIGQHSDTNGFLPLTYLIIYRSYQSLVEILDGLHLQFQITVVSGLIARLNMYEHEV